MTPQWAQITQADIDAAKADGRYDHDTDGMALIDAGVSDVEVCHFKDTEGGRRLGVRYVARMPAA